MRNSWAPRVVALVALSVFSLSNVAFGAPVDSTCSTSANNNKTSLVAKTSSNSTAAVLAASDSSNSGGVNFGSCSPPEIEFAPRLEGRMETSFAPIDRTSYNHGSADNIQVITSFMCLALTNNCKANQAAKNLCAQAQAAANGATPPQTGIQADTFNKFFGFNTDFAAVQPISNTGQPVQQQAKTDPSSRPANTATSSSPNPAQTNKAQTNTGKNLQTFTGALGAKTFAVEALGNGEFQVEGNDKFNNLNLALERSCDVQNDQCAEAAKAAGNKGSLTVGACQTQHTQCLDTIGK